MRTFINYHAISPFSYKHFQTKNHDFSNYKNKISGEYLQNLCSGTDPNCIECVERLPSCRELTDGNNPIATKLWSQSYLVCHKNRTISVDKCTTGVFDPYKKQCVDGMINFKV